MCKECNCANGNTCKVNERPDIKVLKQFVKTLNAEQLDMFEYLIEYCEETVIYETINEHKKH